MTTIKNGLTLQDLPGAGQPILQCAFDTVVEPVRRSALRLLYLSSPDCLSVDCVYPRPQQDASGVSHNGVSLLRGCSLSRHPTSLHLRPLTVDCCAGVGIDLFLPLGPPRDVWPLTMIATVAVGQTNATDQYTLHLSDAD